MRSFIVRARRAGDVALDVGHHTGTPMREKPSASSISETDLPVPSPRDQTVTIAVFPRSQTEASPFPGGYLPCFALSVAYASVKDSRAGVRRGYGIPLPR
jgi:hypothetical protein